MHIGILQCGHAPKEVTETHGDFDAMFRRLLAGRGFRFTTWNVVDMELPESHEAAEGWLITGSRHGVYEPHPWMPPLFELIRAAHAAGQPMLGICFGHQAVAQALGGQVEKFSGGWAIGPTAYAFEGHGELRLNAWHQDQVIRPPEGARILAGNDFCRHAALAIGDTVLTVQAHPEFSHAVFGDYLALRRDNPAYPAGQIDAALNALDTPIDDARLADIMADHLLAARAHA